MLPTAGTLLLILAGSQGTNTVSRALSKRRIVKIGDWSYSIYLWHWPLIVFAALLWPYNPAALAAAALVSLIPAMVSFFWVEQPIRSLVPRSRTKLAGLVVATVLPPLALAAVLGLGASTKWWTTWSTDVAAPGPDDHVAKQRACTDQPFDPNLCRWGEQGANGIVLLVGDSQAYAMADGVIEATARLGMSTVVSSRSGCPFTQPGSTQDAGCTAWQQQVLDYAVATHPTAVVIANRSPGYVNPEWGWVPIVDPDTGQRVSAGDAPRVWAEALSGVVEPLRRARIGVVILSPIPDINDRVDRSSLLRELLGVGQSQRTMQATRSEAFGARARAMQAEQTVA